MNLQASDMDLQVQVPLLDLSPQQELGEVLVLIGYWCNVNSPKLYNKQLCAMVAPMIQQVMSKSLSGIPHEKGSGGNSHLAKVQIGHSKNICSSRI